MDMFEQKRCKSMMTRAEAEFIMKKEVPERAFWIVDCFCNNYNRLQDVLDVLYNTLPGNDYSVSYLASQKGTRLVIFCQVCRIELTSFGPFSSHNNGKSHKRRQQQAASTKSVNKGRTLEHRRLNEPKGIFLKGSLEDLIDSTRFIILGVQFVYKECICGQYCFTCQLCQGDCEVERVNASTMFTHLRSVVHNKKYMEVKYGYVREPDEDFAHDIKEIEEFEGKIHNYIIDFTNQLPDKTAEGSEQYRSCRRSRSSSEPHVCLSSDDEHGRKKPKVNSSPMKMERLSPRVTCSPVKMERLSPRVTCPPVKMESSPVKMESLPVKMESSPVKMERLSPRVTCSPVKMESSPVKMESSLVKIESSPVKIERPASPKLGLETVKSGIKSLESFAELDILPLEARPVLKRDVGITANIMEQGNSFVNYECLMEEECLDMVKVDEDMQRLLIQTLHVLNRKLTKYYSDGDGLNAAPDGVITPLTIFAEKIEQLISELSVITSERGVASHKPHGGVWEEALTEARFDTLPQTAVDTVVEPLLFNCAE